MPRKVPAQLAGVDGAAIAGLLLRWYDRHGRDLPWRTRAPLRPDPYRVWLSEIMLQQTGTMTVAPYYAEFLRRWPRLADLARAELDDVLHAWQGLGYYARARNLHACARQVMRDHGGALPDSEAALADLPGIGPYTAAAIAAIAFGRPAVVVDGNVERVVARLFSETTPLPAARSRLRELAARVTPSARSRPRRGVRYGDFAQAMMDLGATICVARQPHCAICPLARHCVGLARGIAADLPRRTRKSARATRHGVAFWLTRADGAVLLRRRPMRGLLGGMIEIPSTPWRAEPWDAAEAMVLAPAPARWRALPGAVVHDFTHFRLRLALVEGQAGRRAPAGLWRRPEEFASLALPVLMRKIRQRAMAVAGG